MINAMAAIASTKVAVAILAGVMKGLGIAVTAAGTAMFAWVVGIALVLGGIVFLVIKFREVLFNTVRTYAVTKYRPGMLTDIALDLTPVSLIVPDLFAVTADRKKSSQDLEIGYIMNDNQKHLSVIIALKFGRQCTIENSGILFLEPDFAVSYEAVFIEQFPAFFPLAGISI